MGHLFLSYAHANEARVYPFHARMQAVTGHHIWIDKVGLPQVIEWENALTHAATIGHEVIFTATKALAGRWGWLRRRVRRTRLITHPAPAAQVQIG